MNKSFDTPLNFKVFLLFFLPLIAMTQIHQITHSVVHAFLARLTNPKETLAAFSIAFAFNITIASLNQVAIQSGISFFKGRNSFWKVFRFTGTASLILFIAIESVALTPLGDVLFGQWMGASPAVATEARQASAIMAIWVFPIFIRNLLYALVMVNRRTILITIATTVRVGSLALFLFILQYWLDGANIGAAAMVCCMSLETLYMVFAARPLIRRLASSSDDSVPAYRDVWRFSWPLMITQCAENSVALALLLFLGRLHHPDLALAGFGVANGLTRVILAPVRNLTQTAQTMIASRRDLKPMLKYGVLTTAFFVGAVMILFQTPFRQIVLTQIMGLTAELNLYVTPGVKLIYLVAIFWGSSALLRGVLSAMRRTGAIALTAALRLLTVGLVGSVPLFHPQANGTIIGVLAIAATFAVETLFLALVLFSRLKSSRELFPHLEKR